MLTDLLTGSWPAARCGPGAVVVVTGYLDRGQRAADDQLGESVGDRAIDFQIGLDVLLHRECDIGVPDPLAESLPVDLGIPACRRVTVPHVVQVDLRQARCSTQLMEPAGDRVRVRRSAVLLPANRHCSKARAVIGARPTLVLHNDIKIDNCQFGPASAGNGDLARSVPARHFLLVATRP